MNLQERIIGQLNPKLNAKGRKSAEKIARVLVKTEIGAIFTSNLMRAVQTAEIINKSHCVKIFQAPELMEIDTGIATGLKEKEFAGKFPKFAELQKKLSYIGKWPGGESYFDLRKRTKRFLWKVKKLAQARRWKTVLIVGHQEVNRVLIGLLTRMPAKKCLGMEISHDEPYMVDLENKKIAALGKT